MPSLLEFTSYQFFCNSAGIGMFFEYTDYIRFIKRADEYSNVPSPIIPSLLLLLQGIICIVINLGLTNYFPLDFMYDQKYAEFPLWKQAIWWYLTCMARRFFYYGPFKMCNGAVIAAGLSYNGQDKEKKDKWDKIDSVQVLGLELATSLVD